MKKNIIIGALTIVSVLVWTFVISYSVHFKDEIVIQLSDTAQKIALPYRIARLSVEEPDKALIIPIMTLTMNDIADTWGEARSQGRTHEGVDIFARKGAAVFSATDGYVIRAGTNELGGNVVFVIGKGGVRYYYAHLDSIAKGIELGKEVTTDTVLGYVGNTGNATGTPPHLHFGMYVNGAQNPYDLLVPR